MKPLVSWLNLAYTVTLSPTTARDGAADMLSHLFENYLLGGGGSPLADRHSEGVIRTLPAAKIVAIYRATAKQARAAAA